MSKDPIVGVNQTMQCYSARIAEFYNENRRVQILGQQVLCNTGGLISKRRPQDFVVSMQKSKGGTKLGRARMTR
jgi:hypothetical protein